MVNLATQAPAPPAVDEAQAALEAALNEFFGVPRRIAALERRPSLFRSSFTLEEWDVHLESGETLHLVLKDLSRGALLEAAQQAKPHFLRDPQRELCVYRTILAGGHLGTAVCYGAVSDRRLGRYWLFLERVPGVELYQVGEFAVWQQAARWLARMHAQQLSPACAEHLLRYDGDFYHMWLHRAQVFTEANPTTSAAAASGLRRIAERYNQIVDHLISLPTTFIHGEFYASNVLVVRPVNGSDGQVRVCPVDWEMAAIGPGLMDLAAFTAGHWSGEEQDMLAEAYYAALPERDAGERSAAWPPEWQSFQFALDCCRLHIALQWLGWSPRWSPPAEHEHDWLGEALRLADRLGL